MYDADRKLRHVLARDDGAASFAVSGLAVSKEGMLAVLDPGLLLGLGPSRRDESTRIVIVEPDHRLAGLLVDGLGEIRDVEDDELGPPPPNLPPQIASMLSGPAATGAAPPWSPAPRGAAGWKRNLSGPGSSSRWWA